MMSPDTITDSLVTSTSEDVAEAHVPPSGRSVVLWLLGAQSATHRLGMYDTRVLQRSQQDKLFQTNTGPHPWDFSLCGHTGRFAYIVATQNKYTQNHVWLA